MTKYFANMKLIRRNYKGRMSIHNFDDIISWTYKSPKKDNKY